MVDLQKKVALISQNQEIAQEIKVALKNIFTVDVFTDNYALLHDMDAKNMYKAIITEDELQGTNGIPFKILLNTLGHGEIPFIVLLNNITNEQIKLAMKENIAEIFSKPIDLKAIRIRIPYLAENFKNNITVTKELHKLKQYRLPLIKRIFDITFSGLGLLALSPLLAIIALLVRLESKGPVFYYSLRVGSGYKVFKFFKFRSMFTGADAQLKELSHLNQYNTERDTKIHPSIEVKKICEFCEQSGIRCMKPLYADDKVVCEKLYTQEKDTEAGSAFIKIKNDPRITRIGNFIRNTSIDELPQLWNVFIGDMSIVGNRPLPVYEADKITTDKYALRFIAPAGITGLWQVEKRGRGEMSEEERLNLDNNYARTHSFTNDIKLILRTIPALFQTENV